MKNIKERLQYIVIRDLIKNGPLEPLLSDEMLEDIHSIGLKHIHMDHKVFGMVTSNIRFREREILSRYLRAMSERIGRPVSDNKPIIDGALLDGSRINIIFSRALNFEIRLTKSVLFGSCASIAIYYLMHYIGFNPAILSIVTSQILISILTTYSFKRSHA